MRNIFPCSPVIRAQKFLPGLHLFSIKKVTATLENRECLRSEHIFLYDPGARKPGPAEEFADREIDGDEIRRRGKLFGPGFQGLLTLLTYLLSYGFEELNGDLAV